MAQQESAAAKDEAQQLRCHDRDHLILPWPAESGTINLTRNGNRQVNHFGQLVPQAERHMAELKPIGPAALFPTSAAGPVRPAR
jgi:hypothetical protein